MNYVLNQPDSQMASPIPLMPQALWQEYPDLVLPCSEPATNNNQSDTDRLSCLMVGRRKVRQGETLYRERDPFLYLYAVRSGSFKTTLALGNGCEQIGGFHMTGELLGLDGVAEGRHASSAIATEDAEISTLAFTHLSELCTVARNLQDSLMRLISREIVRSNAHLVLLGSLNSAQRLAAFLLNQSQRMHARGYSPLEFHLKMTRGEIGSFLGMTLETVSRTFTELQQQRLLTVERRHIVITNLEGLSRV